MEIKNSFMFFSAIALFNMKATLLFLSVEFEYHDEFIFFLYYIFLVENIEKMLNI